MKTNRLWLAAVVLLAGCGGGKYTLANRKGIVDSWGTVSDEYAIRVRGVGVAPQDTTGTTLRRGLSRDAALVDARKELIAKVEGIKISGDVTIRKKVESDSNLKEIVDNMISNAEEVQTNWADDDSCTLVLELRRDQVESVLARSLAAAGR
jgi:hypothetical protein